MKSELAIVLGKELDNFPSLKEAFTVNQEGIQEVSRQIAQLENEKKEAGEKIALAESLGLPLQAFNKRRTTIDKEIAAAQKCCEAYQSGYLEIPALGDSWELETDESSYFAFRLPGNVPIRVLKAIKAAMDKGIFRTIVVYSGRARSRDPVVAGIINRRVFYITSYR